MFGVYLKKKKRRRPVDVSLVVAIISFCGICVLVLLIRVVVLPTSGASV